MSGSDLLLTRCSSKRLQLKQKTVIYQPDCPNRPSVTEESSLLILLAVLTQTPWFVCVRVCVSPGAADGGQLSAEEPAGSEGRGQVELVETFLPSASSTRCQHGL